MEKVMSNGLCAQVNPLWEQMAVKWLNRKAIVNLDYDEKPMSTYLKMVRGDGDETIGRCHDQIALDGMGSRNVRDIFFGSKHTVTREQFDTLVAAVQEFGHCVKTLKVQLEFGEGKPLPTEYQTIFSSAQNVEFLSFEFQFPGHLESLATLPPQLSFPHLKILSFCTTCIRPLTDGLKWTEESLRAVLGKITAAAPNLADVSAGRDETMGIILEEVAKSGGIRRLEEKIQAIETCPKTRTTTILMETGFENLKTLKLAIRSETRDNFGKIVEKYKHTLEKLHVSLAYGGGGWLIFPKSMDRLEELRKLEGRRCVIHS
ncbi:hypothetical protein Fcan01_24374 [Folsomia candida]|uniref:Uncharacterized protein n=1 Tax=Folsomia candida TaxID=158441 RepID=A0A226D6L7_FOLCA|nr:hypothetical protein Fcan01_24374 [Folsomia candida]